MGAVCLGGTGIFMVQPSETRCTPFLRGTGDKVHPSTRQASRKGRTMGGGEPNHKVIAPLSKTFRASLRTYTLLIRSKVPFVKSAKTDHKKGDGVKDKFLGAKCNTMAGIKIPLLPSKRPRPGGRYEKWRFGQSLWKLKNHCSRQHHYSDCHWLQGPMASSFTAA